MLDNFSTSRSPSDNTLSRNIGSALLLFDVDNAAKVTNEFYVKSDLELKTLGGGNERMYRSDNWQS